MGSSEVLQENTENRTLSYFDEFLPLTDTFVSGPGGREFMELGEGAHKIRIDESGVSARIGRQWVSMGIPTHVVSNFYVCY
jgi:hypothetical protein